MVFACAYPRPSSGKKYPAAQNVKINHSRKNAMAFLSAPFWLHGQELNQNDSWGILALRNWQSDELPNGKGDFLGILRALGESAYTMDSRAQPLPGITGAPPLEKKNAYLLCQALRLHASW